MPLQEERRGEELEEKRRVEELEERRRMIEIEKRCEIREFEERNLMRAAELSNNSSSTLGGDHLNWDQRRLSCRCLLKRGMIWMHICCVSNV